MQITPTDEQNRAIKAISDWYRNGTKPYFYLAGLAGSGKSSLIKLAVAACGLDPDDSLIVLYASYMGKAAMVMQRKGINATTIHKLIYTLLEKTDGQLVFGKNPASELAYAKLLVLDESSYINDDVAIDLLSYGVKILVLGDPGQLEPVSGTGYFTKNTPDFFLHEIHRQALESAIIRLSIDVRNDKQIPFGDFGDVRKITFDDMLDSDLMDADQVITGMHKTRHALNRYMLELDGFSVSYPTTPGVKVMCTRNYSSDGLLNGTIGRTTEFTEEYSEANRWFLQGMSIDDGPRPGTTIIDPLRVNMGAFDDAWSTRTPEQIARDDRIVEMANQEAYFSETPSVRQYLWDFGYAITVHKSLGSGWPYVLLLDDGMLKWKPESRKRFLYTAITRAADKLLIVVE